MRRVIRLAWVSGVILIAAAAWSGPAYASTTVGATSGHVASLATTSGVPGGKPGGGGGGSGSTWGAAEEVPGLGALNQGGDAAVIPVTCASAGNCVAGGYYTDSGGASQAFVVSEISGTWGAAEEVPGLGGLNQGGDAEVSSISCPSAGNCTAVGRYLDGSTDHQAFVVTETNGTWAEAVEVPGTSTLNQGTGAGARSVSCASVGNCALGGFYADASGNLQAFVDDETNGTWGTAMEVPGLATLNQGGDATFASVSCASVGNCSAGGFYTNGAGNGEVYVINEVNGAWGMAEEIPGTDAIDQAGLLDAQVGSVSCPSAGNCSAAGTYAGGYSAFVVNQSNGTWGTAEQVPGIAALTTNSSQDFDLSCPAIGDCTTAGLYADSSLHIQSFVASETNGTWGQATEVSGTATLNKGGRTSNQRVSCASAGNCSQTGSYTDGSGNVQVYVADETNGTWGAAVQVPGTATLNKGGNASLNGISCVSAGNCSAGGSYEDASSHTQGFLVSEP